MVIVFVIIVSLARLKQEITCNHLKDGASQAPYVSWGIVVSTYDNFWGSILPGLNLWGEVVISPATVSHVTYLYHYVLINFGTSLTLTGLLLTSICCCACIVKLVIIVEKIANRFIGAIKAALLGMSRSLLQFSCNRLLWCCWLQLFFLLLLFFALLASIVTTLVICAIATLILLLLSLLLFLQVFPLLGSQAIIRDLLGLCCGSGCSSHRFFNFWDDSGSCD